MRFNADGSPDPSFGSGGRVVTDFTEDSDVAPRNDFIIGLIIQPDGKLVAAGISDSADGVDRKVALARFNPDGSLDPSFGAGGRLLVNFDGFSTLALQPDGKLVARTFNSGLGLELLARFNADGSLDTTFGSGGLVQITFSSFSPFFGPLAVQSDGKLVVAGDLSSFNFTSSLIAVARFNADGSVDTGFGSGGQVLTDFDGRPLTSTTSAVALGNLCKSPRSDR